MEYNIKLNEENHTYEIEVVGKKKPIVADYSGTQVLKEVGVSANYEEVDPVILKKASERGTKLHAQCEAYMNGSISVLDMDKVALSSVLETERLMPTRLGTELALFIEYKKVIIAGSIDICGYRGANNNISVISDYKFTSAYHQVSVEAQLNLYNYMLKKNNGNIVNGKLIKWDNDLVELHPIHNGELKNSILWSDEEVERMLDCLIDGKQFYKNYVLPKDIDVVDLQENEYRLALLEKKVEEFKEKIQARKEMILNSMLEQGVNRIELGNVEYSIKNGYEYESVDSKKLKAEDLPTFEKYKKKVVVKPTLLVNIQEEKPKENVIDMESES
jgi:hypothetical protein